MDMRYARAAAAAFGAAALVAGCTSTPPAAAPHGSITFRSPAGSGPGTPSSPTGPDCPPLKATAGYTSVDYVDFLRFHRRDYITGLDPKSRQPISASQLGPVVLHVRCSLSDLNDRTGKMAAQQRDGDAAFLHPGTPVYVVRGWSRGCRLAAPHDGQLHLYLAYRNGGEHAAPLRCALTNEHS